jgi:hypothetical protein
MRNRVHVAARARVLLEQLDIVSARQQVSSAQPGHARSNDSDLHAHRYSIRVEQRLSRGKALCSLP